MTEPELRALAARDAIPSAEEEAALRKWAAESARPDMLGELRGDVRRLLALIDASRAETAAVVRERDEMVALLTDPVAVHLNMLRGGIARPSVANIVHLYQGAVVDASLAADLVEGLDWYWRTVATGDRTALERDGGKKAAALLTRAAALGVKPRDGEKEKG